MSDNQPELWHCDGCSFTGTEAECEQHVREVGTLANGELKNDEDVTCWGAYEVGGPAWERHKFEGVHPMTTFLDGVIDKFRDQIGPVDPEEKK